MVGVLSVKDFLGPQPEPGAKHEACCSSTTDPGASANRKEADLETPPRKKAIIIEMLVIIHFLNPDSAGQPFNSPELTIYLPALKAGTDSALTRSGWMPSSLATSACRASELCGFGGFLGFRVSRT